MDINVSKLKPDEIAAYFKILNDPVLWAETFLYNPEDGTPFKANPVQRKILSARSQRTVVRVHRRAGKSYMLAVFAMWYTATHDSSKVLIICPDMGKVKTLFASIDEFLRVSPVISGEVIASSESPFMRRKLKNGSEIRGFTAGSSSKTGGKNIRSQTADVVIVDEAAFLNKEDWTAIQPIMDGDATRPNVISFVSSTPTAVRERYYELCTKPDNGWSKVHVPVTENPDYSPERVAEMRAGSDDFTWVQEWLADFPEIGEGRIYKDSYVTRAQRAYEYYDVKKPSLIPSDVVRTMGVDWDKSQGTGPNIVVLELDREHGVFKMVYHEEIPPEKYCLTKATNRIIELNAILNPQHIYVDRGLGETQVEYLHLYGEQYPDSNLSRKVRGVSFSENVEVLDPATRELVKKRIKPYMVNLTVKWFEDNRFVYPKSHKKFAEQLQEFRIVSVSDSNIKYTNENEHIIDAFCLAAYAMHSNFNDPFAFAPATDWYLLPAPEVIVTKTLDSQGRPAAYGTVPEQSVTRKDFGRRTLPRLSISGNVSSLSLRRSF